MTVATTAGAATIWWRAAPRGVTALGTNDDLGSGRLLPSTSITQYAATLGSWMGLSAGELRSVLPNLGEFSTGNLGFV